MSNYACDLNPNVFSDALATTPRNIVMKKKDWTLFVVLIVCTFIVVLLFFSFLFLLIPRAFAQAEEISQLEQTIFLLQKRKTELEKIRENAPTLPDSFVPASKESSCNLRSAENGEHLSPKENNHLLVLPEEVLLLPNEQLPLQGKENQKEKQESEESDQFPCCLQPGCVFCLNANKVAEIKNNEKTINETEIKTESEIDGTTPHTNMQAKMQAKMQMQLQMQMKNKKKKKEEFVVRKQKDCIAALNSVSLENGPEQESVGKSASDSGQGDSGQGDSGQGDSNVCTHGSDTGKQLDTTRKEKEKEKEMLIVRDKKDQNCSSLPSKCITSHKELLEKFFPSAQEYNRISEATWLSPLIREVTNTVTTLTKENRKSELKAFINETSIEKTVKNFLDKNRFSMYQQWCVSRILKRELRKVLH